MTVILIVKETVGKEVNIVHSTQLEFRHFSKKLEHCNLKGKIEVNATSWLIKGKHVLKHVFYL